MTIAHAIGEKNDTMVHHAVHTSIVVAVLGGLIAAVIGELFAVPLLNQLNVPDDVFPLALLYLRIYLAGLPVSCSTTLRRRSSAAWARRNSS